jgi:hypothetical protein
MYVHITYILQNYLDINYEYSIMVPLFLWTLLSNIEA